MSRFSDRATALKAFQTIPGVGPSIAQDLWELGFRSPAQLKRQNPETLYERFCRLKGQPIDRCLLYTFRCAVYFASHERHEPRLLKWWNWMDKKKKTKDKRQKAGDRRQKKTHT